MYIPPHHPWDVTPEEAVAIQRLLREKVSLTDGFGEIRHVAGADISLSQDGETANACVVVLTFPELITVERRVATKPIEFPYVPGLLAFREGPALLDAIGCLRQPFGAICFDGQGYAHPRRCGIACFLAVRLDIPGVGVGKSRLIGTYAEPRKPAGSASPLMDGDEQIGLVLRTQTGIRPIFLSVGHRIDLESAKTLALACCAKYRIPEPTRQADIEVAKLKRSH